ncbi:MAG: hypothetical protein CMJ72_06450 [Planctomycetaceae bacterium]|nr:hypothetical protein [Planctomycetaceae bacterium]
MQRKKIQATLDSQNRHNKKTGNNPTTSNRVPNKRTGNEENIKLTKENKDLVKRPKSKVIKRNKAQAKMDWQLLDFFLQKCWCDWGYNNIPVDRWDRFQ